MTTTLTRDELLVLLIEEAAEVIQAATKCLRFGWIRSYPGYGHNGVKLCREIGELSAIADELVVTYENVVREGRSGKIERAEAAKIDPDAST